MFTHRLYDTFRRLVISRHRSLATALRALRAHRAGFAEHHGGGAWDTTRLEEWQGRRWVAVEERVDEE